MLKQILEVFGEPVSYGGQEAFFFNVFEHMNLEGLGIDVFTPYYCDNEKARKMIQNRGGKLFESGLAFEPGKSRLSICSPLKEMLQKKRYDVVHIHSGSISVLALASYVAKRNGVRTIIVHSHSTGDKKNLKYRVTKSIMTPLLDHCPTNYCACSKEAGEWKFSSRANKKLNIIKNGIDLDVFRFSPDVRQKMRDQLGITTKDYVIGHVGRFSYEKNQEYIIELLRKLKTTIPNIRAILVGDGETKQQIKNQAYEAGMKQSILFPGIVNNVQDYLQAMDVFLLPSLFEGLGIVGIEAQAIGLPVIASLGVPETIQLTKNVKFISLEEIDAWCKAIEFSKDVIRQDQREILRRNGFDIWDTAKEVEKLYRTGKGEARNDLRKTDGKKTKYYHTGI